jgi:putative ABC transport system permease protein
VSQRVPVNDENGDGRTVRVGGRPEPFRVESYIVDDNFVGTYGMQIVAGRGFEAGRPADRSNFVINETAARSLGWSIPSEAIGKGMTWSGSNTGIIIGVVKDFHTTSFHSPIEPLVLLTIPEERWWRTFVSVRIAPDGVDETLAHLESLWRMHAPGVPFNYFFIDESLEQLHRADARFGRTISTFGSLAIFIACIGLFGLAALTAEQRTKEIGIRKVLGASVRQVVSLLCGEVVAFIAIANLIAWPVVYLVMERWLRGFSYRIDLSGLTFILGTLLVSILALLTVSSRALGAAKNNPVEALRHE